MSSSYGSQSKDWGASQSGSKESSKIPSSQGFERLNCITLSREIRISKIKKHPSWVFFNLVLPVISLNTEMGLNYRCRDYLQNQLFLHHSFQPPEMPFSNFSRYSLLPFSWPDK